MATGEEPGKTWHHWMAEQRANSKMYVEEVGLDRTLPNWAARVLDGGFLQFCNLASEEVRDPAFFWMAGYRISSAGREVAGWRQPMLCEVGPGALLLVRDSSGRVLVQAKQEPGNPEKKQHVLLAPTVQAGDSNLAQDHKGKPVWRNELWRDPRVLKVPLSVDGGRFKDKINFVGLLTVADDELTPSANERWFTREEVQQALWAGECNSCLAEVLAFALI